ncbi:unnamed protein product [Moneuplotes crassus]|uniref:Uncharacterized protein n=1 Tax=Euplotes crassus TaxID=5936 RepID=A0AAD1XI40_EUPCR|nr:unnamed protein product [Moneuplotes crassus]
MVSKKKLEEQKAIEEESKELVQSLTSSAKQFTNLLQEEKPGRKDAEALKQKLRDQKTRQEKIHIMNEQRSKSISQKLREQGDLRIQYLKAQNDYFKYFLKNHKVKNDPELYDYRRRIKSEIHHHVLSNIYHPVILGVVVYGVIRPLKSGYLSALTCALIAAGYSLNSLYNTGARFPFEAAYPAHPLVAEKRDDTINRCCYYQPEIIKFELEYLNKKAFKDGYKKQFQTENGHKYEIAVDEGETYINCIDKFDEVFGFRQEALKDNKLMDVLSPEEFPDHKAIVSSMFSVYKDFSEEYLRSHYKPDIKAFKYAIETESIKPEIFDQEDHLLSHREKLRKDLFMRAFREIEKAGKEASQE